MHVHMARIPRYLISKAGFKIGGFNWGIGIRSTIIISLRFRWMRLISVSHSVVVKNVELGAPLRRHGET